jgi:hypothetical protein
MDHNVGPDGERIFGEANIWDVADEVTARPSLWSTMGMTEYQKEMLTQYIHGIYIPQGQDKRVREIYGGDVPESEVITNHSPQRVASTAKNGQRGQRRSTPTGLNQQTLRL